MGYGSPVERIEQSQQEYPLFLTTITMKQLDEKDFEQAFNNTLVTGTYILDKTYVLDYSFKKINFENLEIVNGSFTCSLFQDCRFLNVIFKSIHLDECDFQNCHFENVIFKNCTTENIQFTNCTNTPKIM